MKPLLLSQPGRLLCLLGLGLLVGEAHANRVTIITHGYNASVDEWIVPMANRMAGYTTFWGANSSCYQVTITTNAAGAFQATSQFLDGVAANASDSGNIFIKLDWSKVAGEFNSIFDFYPAPYNVSRIAEAAAPALLDPDLIPDLQGRSLTEFPLHLVGHSRGGVLITEIARELGKKGVWVDHVTMIDPHPCDPSNALEAIGCPVDDVAPVLYVNVVFADNFWQDSGFPDGRLVDGAYNRYLTSMPGGYGNPHSNTHLWYHGTLDFTSPVTTDTGANLTDSDRLIWFAVGETNGTWTGFLNSPVGGGDRSSSEQPAGPGTPAIVDGLTGTRAALPENDGSWPNLITLNAINEGRLHYRSEPGLAVRVENVAYPDGVLQITFDYQSGQSGDVLYFLDPDANALTGNELMLGGETLLETGTTIVSNLTRMLNVDAASVENGLYYLGAQITVPGTSLTRTIYAPQKIAVLEPLHLAIQPVNATESQLIVTGSAGYEAVIESTGAVPAGWNEIGLNAFLGEPIGTPVSVENAISTTADTEFFQARYQKPGQD